MATGDVYQFQDERVTRRGLDLGNDTLLRLGDRRSFSAPIVVQKPTTARVIALAGSPAAEAFSRNVADGAPRSAQAALAANAASRTASSPNAAGTGNS